MTDRYFLQFRRTFIVVQTVLAFLLLIIVTLHGRNETPVVESSALIRSYSVFLLIAAALFAVGLPILIRSGAYERMQKQGLSPGGHSLVQFALLGTVALGELAALIAYLIPVLDTHLYLTTLIAVYGLYTVLPFEERWRKDCAAFQIDAEAEEC